MRLLLGVMLVLALVLGVACAPAAPSPTTAPAKPAEAAKPAATSAPAAKPAAASSPAAKPTAATKPAEKPAAAAAPKKQFKVRISHAGSQTFRLPLYVAIQNGYFKEEGIDLEVVDTNSGSDAMKMLAGKAVELSTGQLVDAVNLNKQGINIVGVAMLTSKLSNSIVVRKSLADQIKSMKDLKGPDRTVGITSVGSGTWQFAVYMGQLEGMKAEDFNFIAVGAGSGVIGAVKAGRVDALSFADPENFLLVRDGDAAFLIDMTDEATHKRLIGDTYLNNQIMVSADYAQANPEAVQGFVNAIQRGLTWAREHSPEDVAKLLKSYRGFEAAEQELLTASLRRQANAVPRTAVITKDAFDNAMKFPVSVGVIKEPLPYEQLVVPRFAEQAAKQYPPK